MVDKRTFDQLLLTTMNRVAAITYIIALDKEGLPISYVARDKSTKQNASTIAAILRMLFTPAYNIKTGLGTSHPFLVVNMAEEGIFIQIRVSGGAIGMVVDKVKWPLPALEFDNLLQNLFKYVPQIQPKKQSMLKDLYAQEETITAKKYGVTLESIPTILACLQKLSSGLFSNLNWVINAPDLKTLIAQIGENTAKLALNTAINIENGDQIYMAGQGGNKLAHIFNHTAKENKEDLKLLHFSPPLLSAYCFIDGEMVLSAPLGQIDGQIAQITIQMPNWNVGLNETASILYTAAVSARTQLGSELSTAFINYMNYMMSDVSALREQIDSLIAHHNSPTARQLMERSSYILQNQQEFSISADYLKWIAYTYFEEGNYEQALSYYKQAANDYERGNDPENLASNLTDIASLYETMNKKLMSVEYYQKALTLYQQLGAGDQTGPIETKIAEITEEIQNKVQTYLKTDPASSISLTTMATRLDLSPSYIPKVIQELITKGLITGSLDNASGTYLKASATRIAATHTRGSSMTAGSNGMAGMPSAAAMTSSGFKVMQIDYSNSYEEGTKLKTQNIQLNNELTQIEQSFQMKGIGSMDILKYQAKLEKKKLNDLKIQILSGMIKFNDPNGMPIICGVCLKEFSPSDTIVVDPNGHGFHNACLSQWIKTQDRCPACNERLLPFVFRDINETLTVQSHTGESGAAGIGSAAEVTKLKEQIEILKKAVGQEAQFFDKLVAERDVKDRLIQDMKKKDQLINELRAQLQASRRM